jgi:hypothetical protein
MTYAIKKKGNILPPITAAERRQQCSGKDGYKRTQQRTTEDTDANGDAVTRAERTNN